MSIILLQTDNPFEHYATLPQSNDRRVDFIGSAFANRNRPACHILSKVNLKQSKDKPVICIVGPTASGKSELGIELALRFSGEIINCDSVQVYKEIEIATAKVSMEERRGVPHHLIDFVLPEKKYTAGEWAKDAAKKIEEIESRGNVAFIVGGTGFYLRALRQPFFESPQTDDQLRNRFIKIRNQRGAEHLHKMLTRIDPETSAKLEPRDWSRVQRALEVYFQTGKRFSEWLPERIEPNECASRLKIFALNPPRDLLYERINRRAEKHFADGLVDEVKTLLAKGVPANSNALGAHGYRRVIEYLKGTRNLESTIEQTKLDVRHYAKRQLTWFRREEGVLWVDGFGDDSFVQEKVSGMILD